MVNKNSKRIREYYYKSRFGYKYLLWGSQHFGFYPKDGKVKEKDAQIIMQDLVGKKLNLSNSMNVLDAGCGRGVVSRFLSQKFGCRITGIDITSFLINEAKDKAKNMGIKNVKYYLMDYSKLKIKNECFDAIYTMETLCHTINIIQTLEELHRVLKKGGKIALFEYTIASDNTFSKSEKEMLNIGIKETASESLRTFRHDNFQNLMKEVGLRKIKVDNITQNMLPSLNRLRIFATVPYFFVKLLKLQSKFPNLTIAVEWQKMMKKGLIRYNIFTAEK